MPRCNLCGFAVVTLTAGVFGRRCLWCLSTFIHRAVGLVVAELPVAADGRVYELSSRGPLLRFLRKRFGEVVVSELIEGLPRGDYRRGVQNQDVQQLTFEDGSFDLVTSTEVFEHVPDDRRGFVEIHRVLAPGGYFVFTVPLSDSAATVERARFVAGRVVHELPPEYHRDFARWGRGVLAYRNYGRDITARLEEAGFEAELRRLESPAHAVARSPVLVCRKR